TLRFDEKEVKVTIKNERVNSNRKKLGAIVGAHVRTGINVSILPGVKIGAYAWIFPGAVVDRDVQRGEFFFPNYLKRFSSA
ncbi:nucleotidyltransferase, partial [Sulfolobus sp. A20-N-F6]